MTLRLLVSVSQLRFGHRIDATGSPVTERAGRALEHFAPRNAHLSTVTRIITRPLTGRAKLQMGDVRDDLETFLAHLDHILAEEQYTSRIDRTVCAQSNT